MHTTSLLIGKNLVGLGGFGYLQEFIRLDNKFYKLDKSGGLSRENLVLPLASAVHAAVLR